MEAILMPLGLLLFFGGAFYLIYSLFPEKKGQEFKRILDEGEVELSEGARFVNLFRPFFQIFLPLVSRFSSPGYKAKVQQHAITAGMEREFSGDDFIAFQITTTLIFALLAFVLMKSWPLAVIGALVGLAYPYLWLYEKKKTRQAEIVSSMPDVVDTLSLSVEAGLDFNASIKRVCEIYKQDNDPFVIELYLMSQNLRLGRSREEALRLMAERVDAPALYSFTSILIQAEKMGASVAEILKSQTARMRQERFMKAERAGAVASQKLLVPMMLLIFPVIFIVIFAPYVLKFIFK